MSIVLTLVQSSPITVAEITVNTATGISVGTRLGITGYTAGNSAANGVYIVQTITGTTITATRADNANTINTTGTGSFIVLADGIPVGVVPIRLVNRRKVPETTVPFIPGGSGGGGGGGGGGGTRSGSFGF